MVWESSLVVGHLPRLCSNPSPEGWPGFHLPDVRQCRINMVECYCSDVWEYKGSKCPNYKCWWQETEALLKPPHFKQVVCSKRDKWETVMDELFHSLLATPSPHLHCCSASIPVLGLLHYKSLLTPPQHHLFSFSELRRLTYWPELETCSPLQHFTHNKCQPWFFYYFFAVYLLSLSSLLRLYLNHYYLWPDS